MPQARRQSAMSVRMVMPKGMSRNRTQIVAVQLIRRYHGEVAVVPPGLLAVTEVEPARPHQDLLIGALTAVPSRGAGRRAP